MRADTLPQLKAGEKWGPVAPVLLLLLLSVTFWILTPEGPRPAWLERAISIEQEVRQTGRDLFDCLGDREDPRVGPSILLLLIGCAPSLITFAMHLLGLVVGAGAVLQLARGATRGKTVSAWILASSPIWIQGSSQANPALLAGLLLLLMSRGVLPWWLAGIGLGWCLGWSPWVWVTLPLVAAGGLLRGGRDAQRAAGVLVLGLILFWVFAPPALLRPGGWLAAMRWQMQVTGFAGAATSVGTGRGLWPLLGSLHVPALLFVAASIPYWPRRVRDGDFGPLACLAAVAFALPSGFSNDVPLLVLLPWGAGEAGRGLSKLVAALRDRGRLFRPLGFLMTLVLVVPLLWVFVGRLNGTDAGRSKPADVDSWLSERVAPGILVAYDLGFAPPDSTPIDYLAIPFHSLHPEICRGAYWIGWFGGFGAVVVSEGMVTRFLRRAEEFPEMIAFYSALRRLSTEEGVFGTQPGKRTRVLLLDSQEKGLGDGWQARVLGGERSGLPGSFLAHLGGALARSGRPGDAIALLEEALAAGYEDVGIYLNLANAHLELDRAMEAGRLLDEALGKHPDAPRLRYNLALILTRVGFWDRAVQTLIPLREVWPRSADVAYLLGISLANSGHPEAAVRYLEEALELNRNLPQREEVMEHLRTLRSEAR